MFSRGLLQSAQTVVRVIRRNYQKDVAIIGYPYGGGQLKKSIEHSPRIFRENGLIKQIEALGRTVVDYGDCKVPEEYSSDFPSYTYFPDEVDESKQYFLKNAKETGLATQNLADLCEKAARDDKLVLTLGGDHSLGTGSLLGHLRARENACVIWVDAHNDINNYKTSPSGNLHGMCLSPVLKGLPDFTNVPGYEWTKPMLNPRDIVYIGLRDTDPKEYEITEEMGIAVFSMHDVDHLGIANVIERAVEMVNPKLNKPIHVSFDVDVLDLDVCPGTGTPINAGFTLREALYIGETINKTGLLGGLDIVEVNPRLCKNDRDWEITLDTAFQITKAFLGWHRPGYATHVQTGI